MTVTFAYNGSTTVTATITGATPGAQYAMAVDGPPYPSTSGTVDGSGNLTLTGAGISVSAGFEFDVWVTTGTNPFAAAADFVAATIFEGGSTTDSGLTATWAFDGTDTVSITAVFTNGVNYIFQILDHNGGSSPTTFTGTGASQTVTNSTAAAADGNYFYAYIAVNSGSFPVVANRLFNAGAANNGFPGNPGGGAADGGGGGGGDVNAVFDSTNAFKAA